MRCERGKRDELCLARQLWNQEPAQRSTHGPSDYLAQGLCVAPVGRSESLKVPQSMLSRNNGWRVAVLDQHEIEDEPSNSTVAVREGMDPFKPGVVDGGVDEGMTSIKF